MASTQDPPPAYPFSSHHNVKQRAANRRKRLGDSAQGETLTIDILEGRFKRLGHTFKAAPGHITDPPVALRLEPARLGGAVSSRVDPGCKAPKPGFV
jgi:hypothetical protein